MKIIADTNIWYGLGQDPELFDRVKDEPIYPTFININELSRSGNLLNKEEFLRSAIKKLFAFKNNTIFEPPFIYLAQLHQEYNFDPKLELRVFLDFTSKFAQGMKVEPSMIEAYRNELEIVKSNLQSPTEYYNQEAKKIRERISDKKTHKKIDTTQLTAGFINFCVGLTTKNKCNLVGFDLTKIELLVNTLDLFFKTIETSKMNIQANDWFDFAILAYLQPGDKYWTREKRWRNLIKEAGCSDYLYVE